MIDYKVLAAEIASRGKTAAPLEIANELNAVREDIRLPRGVIPAWKFAQETMSEQETIQDLPDEKVRAKWLNRYSVLTMAGAEVDMGDYVFGLMLKELIADGILKDRELPMSVDDKGDPVMVNVPVESQIVNLTTVPGSRAEQLFGAGTIITEDDVLTAWRQ